jgi:hypothetical protein
MLSRISSIAVLSLVLSASAAFAQTNVTLGRNAVNEALRAREAETQAARPNTQNGVGVNPSQGGEVEILPDDPLIDTGVYEPTDFTISRHDQIPTHVGLRWWNGGGPQTQIFRSADSGGPWTLLQTLGPQPSGAYVDYLDQGATINAENCYRVSVSDGVNRLSTKNSPVRCAYTRPDSEDDPLSDPFVHRLQLRIQIASAADADTDNTIEVRLQSPVNVTTVTNWNPAGNSTWVDSTIDDFERGSDRRYDLMIANIGRASDITQITLAKPGDDDVCIAALELFVDGDNAFSRNYGNSTSQCQWLRGNNQLSISFAELRAHPDWMSLHPNTFLGFDAEGLRSVIGAKFGHFLHGRGELQNYPLTTAYVSETRMSVTVPIIVYDAPVLGNVDSIVRFDLVLTNADGRAQMRVENVDANSSDLLVLLAPLLSGVILHGVSEEIEAQIQGIGATNADAPEGLRPCFQPNGSLSACSGDWPS